MNYFFSILILVSLTFVGCKKLAVKEVDDLEDDSILEESDSNNVKIIPEMPRIEDLPNRDSLGNNLGRMAVLLLKKESINLETLFYYCGKPDAYKKADNEQGQDVYLYFYDRKSTKSKWVAYVLCNQDGNLYKIGFNEASVNDHSDYEIWNSDRFHAAHKK